MANNKWTSSSRQKVSDWWNGLDKNEKIELLIKAKVGLSYGDYSYEWLPDEMKEIVKELRRG